MKFGDNLFQLRTEADLTQDTLVDSLNKKYNPDRKFNKAMISKWENNIHIPENLYQVILLAEFFGVNPDWMMGISDFESEYFRLRNIPCSLCVYCLSEC